LKPEKAIGGYNGPQKTTNFTAFEFKAEKSGRVFFCTWKRSAKLRRQPHKAICAVIGRPHG
jgi:hypothetical protein